MSNQKLYISHAAKDKALADELIELITGVTPLQASDIAATDINVAKAGGKDIVSYLRSHFQGPEAVILLLTPNYFSSAYCLCEMGAGCAVTSNILPLLVPPLTEKKLQGVISVAQAIKIDDTDDLNRLVTQLQNFLALGELNLPRWAMNKKKFLSSLPALTSQA